MKVTQIVVEEAGAHAKVSVWIDRKLSGTLTVDLEDGHRLAKLLQGTEKLDVSKEPHWLYKDFNVLYRVLKVLVRQIECAGFDQMALMAARAQLERLAPAFADTEEIRAAMRQR